MKKSVSVAYLHKKRKQIYSMLYLGNLWQTKPTSARFQCTSSGGIGEAKSSIGGKKGAQTPLKMIPHTISR